MSLRPVCTWRVLRLQCCGIAPGQMYPAWTIAPTDLETQNVAPVSMPLGTCLSRTCQYSPSHCPPHTHTPSPAALPSRLGRATSPSWNSFGISSLAPCPHLWGLAVCPSQTRTKAPYQLTASEAHMASSCHPTPCVHLWAPQLP